MGIDHSTTYRDKRFRNRFHRDRLRTILSVLERDIRPAGKTLADVGCSNGYIAGIIHDRFRPARVCGYDHDDGNLAEARGNFPAIEFRPIDLNRPVVSDTRYDIVTCFEVIEHVGHPENAVDNLFALTRPGGKIFLTVPIEIGWRGTAKFIAKTVLYRYRMDELPPRNHLCIEYAAALLLRRRMNVFRDQREGWGTHFGFDYRQIDDLLRARAQSFNAFNRGTSRFYIVDV